jgi:hypothetical protein
MAEAIVEFARSQNGDRWYIGRHQSTGFAYVIHEGNESSGGHRDEVALADFLGTSDGDHPERLKLLRLIGAWAESARYEEPGPSEVR